MDPIVAAAAVTAIGASVTALIARRGTQKLEESKTEAIRTSNELAGVQVQLDAWPQLYDRVVGELEREKEAHRADVAEERSIAEAFSNAKDRLTAERDRALEDLRHCRQQLAERLQEEPPDEQGGT